MALDVTEIEVCLDCAVMIANGDGPPLLAERIAEYWTGYELSIGTGEAFFSHYGCDGCGDTLAGDRLDATAIVTR
jgi:hypothetical protein